MTTNPLRAFCGTLLLMFAGFCLSSCSTPQAPTNIVVSYGTPSLKRHHVVQTAQKYETQRPATLQQMCDLLGGEPLGTHTDNKGKYCFWRAYEEEPSGGHQSAAVGCLVNKKGEILKSYISYNSRPFDHKEGPGTGINLGDVELKDSAIHPGLDKAIVKPFREVQIQRGFVRGQEVAFSPSGANSVFLPHGAYVKEWVGETPNVCYPAAPQQQQAPTPQQQAPAPAPQQNGVKSLLDTANTTMKLIQQFM